MDARALQKIEISKNFGHFTYHIWIAVGTDGILHHCETILRNFCLLSERLIHSPQPISIRCVATCATGMFATETAVL